eukprot:gene6987-7056_t
MTSTILIVDDDPVQRRLLEATVRRFGYQTEVVDGGEAAIARLEAVHQPTVDLMILDLVMPDLDGMGVLAHLRKKNIQVPVIAQTAHGSIDTVISAMRAGAIDFVVKPVGAERLQISIKNALQFDALADEVRMMKQRASGNMTFKDMVTRSPDMDRVIRLGDELTVTEFPQIAAQMDGFDVRVPMAPSGPPPRLEREIVRVEVKDPNALTAVGATGEVRALADIEADMIRFAIQRYRGQMSEVARRLGIGRSTLYRKMSDLGLGDQISETPVQSAYIGVLPVRHALLCTTLIAGCVLISAAFAQDVPNPSNMSGMIVASPIAPAEKNALLKYGLDLPALKVPSLVFSLDAVSTIDKPNALSNGPLFIPPPPGASSVAEPAAPIAAATVEEPTGVAKPEDTVKAEAPAKTEPSAPIVAEQTGPAASDQIKAALELWQARPAANAGEHKLREAIVALYTARQFAPLWNQSGQWTPQSHAALARVERASEDGLNLNTAPRPNLGPSLGKTDLGENELLLTDLVAHYAAQAMGNRIDPLEISKLITAKATTPDFADILNRVATADNADAVLQATNPPQKAYADLRAKLAELRREARPMAQKPIPSGPVLKVGMKDARVPLIRERFGLAIEQNMPAQQLAAQDIIYDTRVAAAVADFQTSNGLPVSGTLTPRTIAALSGGEPARLDAELVANMEVWRWLPRDLGHDRIEVNLTEFAARLYRDDKAVYRTKVVVGKPTTPTPVFSNKMQFLIVNPYWNVPLSIVKKEMMPKAATDPDYFNRHGYQLVQRGNMTYVRQPPGDANALGRIKFMFPNEHSVYLHDTPSKSFFARNIRAFSHGCVRVDQPFRFAEAVLGQGWSEQRVRSMIGGQERTVNLPEALPIHIMYFTTNVDENGKLQIRDDLYGYIQKVKQQLGLAG